MADPDTALDEGINDEMASMFDLKAKKKKPKKKATKEETAVEAEAVAVAQGNEEQPTSSRGPMELDPPTYSYLQLLNRVVDFVHQVRVPCASCAVSCVLLCACVCYSCHRAMGIASCVCALCVR